MISIKRWKYENNTSYREVQMKFIKSDCRWLVRKFRKKSFVLDDESIFTFSEFHMPVNDSCYPLNKQNTRPNMKYVFRKKSEIKFILYLFVTK